MTLTSATTSPATADLSACEREPIRIPGSIQPHGVLVVLEPQSFQIRQVSANAPDRFGRRLEALIGSDASAVLPANVIERIRMQFQADPGLPNYAGTMASPHSPDFAWHVLAHQTPTEIVVELEEANAKDSRAFDIIYSVLQSQVARLVAASGVNAVCNEAANLVCELTGFDRVLVYQFDHDWNGIVVAERRNDRLPSYLGQRFPASDIPAQARELYRLNPVRQIPDAGYTPVPIVPALKTPLDLSFSSLRSVSPVHVEYMRNMGTAASMSLSIVVGGRLWGLVSCHHSKPRAVPFHVRTACTFLAQIVSQQIVSSDHAGQFHQRMELKSLQSRLLAQMAAETDLLAGLTADRDVLLQLAGASGAAIVLESRCVLVGQTPSEAQTRQLAHWLDQRRATDVIATSQLSAEFPPASEYAETASGILAIAISKLHAHYLIWFRPELVRTLTWAGDPTSKAPDIHTGRIHPRNSFAAWKQIVRNTSAPWSDAEIEAASELRNNIVGIVLRKAEELAALSGELERSNKELEAFSYSVSHDLRAPFRHIVGYAELLRQDESRNLNDAGRRYIDTIIESAHYAGTLVDNLLSFSQMGRASLAITEVNLRRLFAEGWSDLRQEIGQRRIAFELGDLPVVQGDLMMLRLVVQNLLSNAVKYTRTRAEAHVQVRCSEDADKYVLSVSDNGVGFDMKYVGKLFGVFQRLHKMEDFEGTGIGLANVRRIVERHGGRAWAEGVMDQGATIYFSLPKKPLTRETHG